MTPEQLLEIIREAVAKDPGLLLLTVIVMAILDLEKGNTAIQAIHRISVDLDKIKYGESEEFGRWCGEAAKCAQAYDSIHAANQVANNGRGSSVVHAMLLSLLKFDLHEAQIIYGNDGDKIEQYPALKRAIVNSAVGCRMHHRSFWCPVCNKL